MAAVDFSLFGERDAVVPSVALLHEKKDREREAIIARAKKQQLEQREEVRLMNQMVNACLTMSSLDDQVCEASRAAQLAGEQRAAADAQMAEAWKRDAAAAEEMERQRWLQYRAGEATLLEQLEERARQAKAAKKVMQAEGAACRAAAERETAEAEQAELKRRAAGAALLEEIGAFNAMRLGRHAAAQREQREQDAAISRLLAEKDAKEQAAAEAGRAARKAAELKLAQQWADAHRTEKDMDQALENWIQYQQDAKDAAEAAKEEEREAARRQACMDQQQAMRRHKEWKIAAQRDRQLSDQREADKAAAAATAARLVAEQEDQAKAAATQALRQALTVQVQQKQDRERETRAAAAQAVADAVMALEKDRATLRQVKEEKLKLLAGAPSKYLADLQRFTIA